MKLSDFSYHLPEKCIAKTPAEPRDSSKLLVLNAKTGALNDDQFYNLDVYLQSGDILIRNNTKVIPARIFGHKNTGGKIEVLLVKKHAQLDTEEVWECLTKPSIKPGQTILFSPPPLKKGDELAKKTPILTAQCVDEQKSNNYTRLLKFSLSGSDLVAELEKIGVTPLPPYISDSHSDTDKIRKQYQTTYAKHSGSAAAPTAGLHFTKELDEKLLKKGVSIAEVTLHVGLGTFLPVKTENVLEHQMHSEWFEIPQETIDLLHKTKAAGKRAFAVGTTSARVLESVAQQSNQSNTGTNQEIHLTAQTGETEIFIYPGYKFSIVDGLITNFHLPKSTLLMLVSALVCAPNTPQQFTSFLESSVGAAYLHAIANDYRFYSFGDAMLIM